MPQPFLGATASTRSPGIAACVSWRETPRYVGSAERRNESGEGAQTDGQAALKITSRISERIRPRARKTIRACPSPPALAPIEPVAPGCAGAGCGYHGAGNRGASPRAGVQLRAAT
jgi:hypothetical protein